TPTVSLPWTDRPRSSEERWVPKDAIPVVMDAGPYRVYGWAHVPAGKPLADLLYNRYGRFIPVTEARVRPHPALASPDAQDQEHRRRLLGVVRVNRDYLQIMAPIAAPPAPQVAPPRSLVRLDLKQLTELMLNSTVFHADDVAAFTKLLTRLS